MSPKSPRGERTRAAFLDAARKEFAENGYFNAKIADIAERAGKSSGSFYNYYENKELLLVDLINEFPRDVLRHAFTDNAKTLDLPARLEAAVRAYYEAYRKYLPEMVGVFHMSMTEPKFRERWLSIRAAGIRTLVADIERLRGRSAIPKGVDSGLLASALVSMLEGFCWVWLANGGEQGVKAPSDEQAVATLAYVWSRAVLTDKSGQVGRRAAAPRRAAPKAARAGAG
jgi:AcrR family transcriptional regulator